MALFITPRKKIQHAALSHLKIQTKKANQLARLSCCTFDPELDLVFWVFLRVDFRVRV